MAKAKMTPLPDTAFWRAYDGSFSGILKWQDVDRFWAYLAQNPEGWHVFDPDGDAPDMPMTKTEFARFLTQAKALVNSRRERSLSGAIYVDNMAEPTFAKIFDPVNMGSACNVSGTRTMPRWVVSRIKPDALPKVMEPLSKPGLFGRLVGRSAG
jgi:hypothetical protein